MSTLSAAELQRRHELEGAPDPFPSLGGTQAASKAVKANGASSGTVDPSSEAAFPSLASTAASKPVAAQGAWGAGPRIQTPSAGTRATGSLEVTLPAIDLTRVAGSGKKPPTLLDYQKTIGSKFRVLISSRQQRSSGQITFIIKSDSDKDIAKARKHLIVSLSPVTKIEVQAPNSTLPSIIGPSGANINAIRDKTGARIDVPRREGETGGVQSDEDDEPTTTITITAPQPLALEARALIQDIIGTKKANTTRRIREVPAHILPFIKLRRTAFINPGEEQGEASLTVDEQNSTVVVSGDRETVKVVADAVIVAIDELKTSLMPLKMGLPKKQHRLLTSAAILDILQQTNCVVTVPGTENLSDEIQVWGNITQGTNISAGLQAVLAKVNSQYTQEFKVPSKSREAFVRYVERNGLLATLRGDYPDVTLYFPTRSHILSGSPLSVDLVGGKESVEKASNTLSKICEQMAGGGKRVKIDPLCHRIIQSKFGKRLRQIHDSHDVFVYIPSDSEASEHILLLSDPLKEMESTVRNSALEAAAAELQAMAKECGDFSSRELNIEAKWHQDIRGQNDTTLNALQADDRTVSIQFSNNSVTVRGNSTDVDRVAKEIQKIADSASKGTIEHDFTTEFEIPREFVKHLVGANGVAAKRLRDLLGVKVDFVDEAEDKDASKKKKTSEGTQKTLVKINGRRENVEEAQRRIKSQVARLADETAEILKIPTQYHASLIGSSGKYVSRLEEKYNVKITFPRDASSSETRTRETLKADEVLIKGGRKGVANAKAELVDALEFEKESNNVTSFKVLSKARARILGRGGATIQGIKNETDTQIDMEKDAGEMMEVTVRGSKKGIASAKIAILAICSELADEADEIIVIDQKLHRTIIGSGGQGLRDLILRCGGPTESRAQAALVRFPRQGEQSNEIQLRGERKLVKKIKTELEKEKVALSDRVIVGVAIPAVHHKILIGKGGQNLNDIQNRLKVQVQFPGSRSYGGVGDISNTNEIGDHDAAEIVKIIGSQAACTKASEELKAKVPSPKADTLRPGSKASTQEKFESVVLVPVKYHHFIDGQGALQRSIRACGVRADVPSVPKKAAPVKPQANTSARIDDEESSEIQWQVVSHYQSDDENTVEWRLRANDESSLDRARNLVDDALQRASSASHVGFLTLPDSNAFPRIVGMRGANVARLREETGTDITVGRDEPVIIIIGDINSIEEAKSSILATVNARRQ